MSTSQERCNADSESATDCDNGGATSGGSQSSGVSGGDGDEQQSVDVIEIVGLAEIDDKNKEERRQPNVSECSVDIADLEAGKPLHLAKTETERDCRICHLSMDAANPDSEIPFELGCSCKDDLAAAHKQCAEAWFKIKGDKTCEICGSVAENVGGVRESWNEMSDTAASQSRNLWQGHRFLNFLLACMVFAFVISWLFHFNVPS